MSGLRHISECMEQVIARWPESAGKSAIMAGICPTLVGQLSLEQTTGWETCMAGINKVILVGNLGSDPEVRYMPSGDAVANFSLATSDSWKDKSTGERQERTEWHKVAMFGKVAEIAQQYLHKGSKVYIEGQLQTRKWQGQDGSDRYTTEVVVRGHGGTMQMLDGKQEGAQGDGRQPSTRPKGQHKASYNAQKPASDFEDDDDIPF